MYKVNTFKFSPNSLKIDTLDTEIEEFLSQGDYVHLEKIQQLNDDRVWLLVIVWIDPDK